MIKYRTEKVINVQDWDDLVEKTYGRPYSFQQQEGCKSRGTFHLTVYENWDDVDAEKTDSQWPDTLPEKINGDEMQVNFKAWLAADPKKPIKDGGTTYLDLWWNRNFYPDVQMIAQDLYKKGLIEAGDYIINIDW
jgi:hypothetical protein